MADPIRIPLDADLTLGVVRRDDDVTVLILLGVGPTHRIELTQQQAGQLAGALLTLGAVEEPAVVTLPPEPWRSPC